MDDRNETLELKRKAYTLLFVKPCMSDKTKKMAEVRLARPGGLEERLPAVRLDGYKASYSAELKVLRLTRGKKSLLVFNNGTVSIRNADDEQDVLETLNVLLNALDYR